MRRSKQDSKRKKAGLDLAQQMRLMGGMSAYSPSDCWFNLCSMQNWPIENDVDEPQRFQPAFFTFSKLKGRSIPVVVEPYSYLPGDKGDPLAEEAMAALPTLFPNGVLLVFRGMPFMEVSGRSYTFGGLLLSDGVWHQIAINQKTHGFDDLIAQIESGFRFGLDFPDYADEKAEIATAFSAMSYATEPGISADLMSMRAGGWTILIG